MMSKKWVKTRLTRFDVELGTRPIGVENIEEWILPIS